MQNVNNTKLLTIIIVLFKEPFDLINETLKHIKNYRLIIIDNANNHELKKKILERYKIYKYILNNKNNGFSAGYNQGLKISDTKFTLVLGPDCLISSRNINIMINKILIYKDALIVSPTAYNNKNELTYSGGPLPENGKKDEFLNLDGDVCVESSLGACMLFRTLDIKRYNLFFDENFFLYFSDDDLCRKVKLLNRSVIQIKDAVCIHQHGIIKVKNKFKKIYIREFNYTHDMLYYFYKIKNEQSYKIIRDFQRKTKSYFFLLVFRLLTFKYSDFIKIFSRWSGFYKFRSKYLK
jgi:N-acetylglucosaminyl-diphospho-decaprenol L-rhamnosyltransferase